jgi:hypothetical protein
VGLPHVRKSVRVTVGADTYQVTVEPGIAVTAPRTTSRGPAPLPSPAVDREH